MEKEENGEDAQNTVNNPADPDDTAEKGTQLTVVVHTDAPVVVEAETPAPARGDGPRNKPVVR